MRNTGEQVWECHSRLQRTPHSPSILLFMAPRSRVILDVALRGHRKLKLLWCATLNLGSDLDSCMAQESRFAIATQYSGTRMSVSHLDGPWSRGTLERVRGTPLSPIPPSTAHSICYPWALGYRVSSPPHAVFSYQTYKMLFTDVSSGGSPGDCEKTYRSLELEIRTPESFPPSPHYSGFRS